MMALTLSLDVPIPLITRLSQHPCHNANNKEPLAGDAGETNFRGKEILSVILNFAH